MKNEEFPNLIRSIKSKINRKKNIIGQKYSIYSRDSLSLDSVTLDCIGMGGLTHQI